MQRKDKLKPTVFGRGFMGHGDNSSRYGANLPKTKKYLTWFAMMQRCYSENSLKRKPTYIGCEVDKRWWNFQVFCEWFDKNYYEIEDKIMCLDKDILVNGNKIYSPETCVFVPQEINKLLTLRNRFRGDCPLGVRKSGKKYSSFCNYKNKSINLGVYTTPEEAHNVYLDRKQEILIKTAEEYKKVIPVILYDALMSYKIETN